MSRIQKKNGVTILALVITIVIMLLLAGVVLQMAMGENGLVAKSTQAKAKQAKAELYENAKISFLNLKTKALAENQPEPQAEKVLEEPEFLNKYDISGENIVDKHGNVLESKENLINTQNKYKGKVNMQIIASDISLESKIKEIYIFIRKENPDFIINNLNFYNNDKFFDSDSKNTSYEYQLNSLYLFSKLFLRDMIKNQKGNILNTLSVDFYNKNLLNADYLGLESYLKELTRYVNKTIKKEKLNVGFYSLLLKNRKDLNSVAKYSLKKINSKNADIKLNMLYKIYKMFNKE